MAPATGPVPARWMRNPLSAATAPWMWFGKLKTIAASTGIGVGLESTKLKTIAGAADARGSRIFKAL